MVLARLRGKLSTGARHAGAERQGSVAGLAVFLAPLAEFDHLSAGNDTWLGFGLERVGRQLDFYAVGAELGDGSGMTLITGHREFKVIHARQALAAVGIGYQADFFKRDVFIQQVDIKLFAVLFEPLQCPFAQAVVVPNPGGAGGQQHQDEDVSQGQHSMNSNKVSAA